MKKSILKNKVYIMILNKTNKALFTSLLARKKALLLTGLSIFTFNLYAGNNHIAGCVSFSSKVNDEQNYEVSYFSNNCMNGVETNYIGKIKVPGNSPAGVYCSTNYTINGASGTGRVFLTSAEAYKGSKGSCGIKFSDIQIKIKNADTKKSKVVGIQAKSRRDTSAGNHEFIINPGFDQTGAMGFYNYSTLLDAAPTKEDMLKAVDASLTSGKCKGNCALALTVSSDGIMK